MRPEVSDDRPEPVQGSGSELEGVGPQGDVMVWRAVMMIGAILCLILPLPAAIALIAGIGVAVVCRNPAPGTTAAVARWLLKVSVVGLGCGMNLLTVWQVAAQGVVYTAVGILLTLFVGLLMGRAAKMGRDISLLIATGTAICGGSAIAAVAGVIRPKQHDLTIALTAVFLLNALALFLFPWIGHTVGFTPHEFGLWAALAIHDTSSVVGAAGHYGGDALAVATTVKLTRALWIVPVALVIGKWWPRESEDKGNSRRPGLPFFILGFLFAAALFTYVPALAGLRSGVTAAAQRLFAITLFLIGAGFSREALQTVGLRPLVVAAILWVLVASASGLGIAIGWIR